MSNISGQLIKDSYNYVLQSDLISGIVYRIGGSVAENPKFISGLTVNANFTYSNDSICRGDTLDMFDQSSSWSTHPLVEWEFNMGDTPPGAECLRRVL